jgi:hypothetical protein
MDAKKGRLLVENLNMAMMLSSWRHVCQGHLPGLPPADKSKFKYNATDYEKIIGLLLQALGKNKGAVSADIYSDSQNNSVAVIIATFDTSVGTSNATPTATECMHVFCILQADGGNAQKTIFKTAYPSHSINPKRFTKLGPIAIRPAPMDPGLAAMGL